MSTDPPAPYRVGFTTFGCDAGRSGIGRYAMVMLRELVRLAEADRFVVLTHAVERAVFVSPDLAATGRVTAVTVPELWRPPLTNVVWHQVGLPAVVRAAQLDVLFIPAGNRRLPWSAPCPTVGVVHDLSSLHVTGKYDRRRVFYITHVLPRLVRRLTEVITISESSRQDLLRHVGLSPERVHVTPLAADLDRFRPGDPVASARRLAGKYGLLPPYILYTARIEHPGKNHVRLIQAFERLKAQGLPHQLVLAGPDKERAEVVHAMAASSPAADSIRFLGFVDEPDLPDLYRGAELFTFPSLYEGFGLPVLEALACGTPVACAGTSSLPEVTGDAGVLYDPRDVDGMAAAMSALLSDDARRAELARRGRLRAQEFSWERTARATLRAIHHAAVRPTGRRA